MNVPAWPMPIHQTKLMMPKPQATGTLLPHRPMPRSTVHVTKLNRITVSNAQIATANFQPRVNGRHVVDNN